MIEAKNYIGGKWVTGSGKEPCEQRNPARMEEIVGICHSAGAEETDRAVEAAAGALPGWKGMAAGARSELLHRIANRLENRTEELAKLISREMGKPIGEARGEVKRGVVLFRYYAGEGLRAMGEVYRASDGKSLLYSDRVPLGVVGLITPWNFPAAIPIWKMAPALIFGNTIVWKPAEPASLTAFALAQILEESGLPPGVANLVIGKGSVVGEGILRHPRVQGISFTGSNEVGKKIALAAVGKGAKYQLEMGGKNPTIIAADADIERAAAAVVGSAMRFAGQKCTATSRVIVEKSVEKSFVEALLARVAAVKMSDPLEEDCDLGPVVNRSQQSRILRAIEQGKQEGARLLCGGAAPGGALANGAFVEPTVFDRVEPNSCLARQEIFGPVLAVQPAEDLSRALELANDVEYGLSGAIFTRDIDRIFEFLKTIDAGHIKINGETTGVEPHAPFGGMKQSSSHSREQGRAAIEFFTSVQTIAVSPSR